MILSTYRKPLMKDETISENCFRLIASVTDMSMVTRNVDSSQKSRNEKCYLQGLQLTRVYLKFVNQLW